MMLPRMWASELTVRSPLMEMGKDRRRCRRLVRCLERRKSRVKTAQSQDNEARQDESAMLGKMDAALRVMRVGQWWSIASGRRRRIVFQETIPRR